MVFSLNFLKIFSFNKSLRFPLFQDEGNGSLVVNRNVEFDQKGEFSVIAPAFGIDLTNRLSLGITFNIWNHSLTDNSRYKESHREFGQATFGPVTLNFDAFLEDIFEVEEGYSFVIGGMYRPSKEWTIAAVVKPGFTMDIDHTHREEICTESGSGPIVCDSDPFKNNAELEQPTIVGVGTAWRPTEELTFSTDVTWTDWSAYVFRENEFDFNPITGTAIQDDKLDNSFTVRFGGEYLVILENYVIPIRCGFGYDPAPSIDGIDDFYTANFGTGIQLYDRVNLDLAYEFRWGKDVNGRTSLGTIGGTQDIYRHRVLGSVIFYF